MVPLFYKSSYITPIFKEGGRARVVNYRSISLTSHVIKIYERVLRKTMVSFIEDNNIICDNQMVSDQGVVALPRCSVILMI